MKDEELLRQFQIIAERQNTTDRNITTLCKKVDDYDSKKKNQVIMALIGSPVVTVIVTFGLTNVL